MYAPCSILDGRRPHRPFPPIELAFDDLVAVAVQHDHDLLQVMFGRGKIRMSVHFQEPDHRLLMRDQARITGSFRFKGCASTGRPETVRPAANPTRKLSVSSCLSPPPLTLCKPKR